MNAELVHGIQELVVKIREENHIVNEIIRDDVFSILQACECAVLYYPLEGEEEEGCDGCHVVKYVNGRPEQFVFINTNNTRERQAFSAAHELGHIWKVDERLRAKCPEISFNPEEVINRFAAELLIPETLFRKEINDYLCEMQYVGPKIKDVDLLQLIVRLMNQFFVPFKSVVLRLVEIGRLQNQGRDHILKYKNSPILEDIIKAGQYTRLGIKNKLISMDKLPEYLVLAEEQGTVSPAKIAAVRQEFGIGPHIESPEGEIKF